MRIHFLGANRQVTGSRYLLESRQTSVMIDCGLFQERCFQERNWADPPVDPGRVDALLLTHGHLDHCGLIPKFVREGYANPIYSTPPSLELAKIVLEDSGHIQEEDAAYKKRRHQREGRQGAHPVVPLYTAKEAQASFRGFRHVLYDRPQKLNDHLEVTYRDAGHILGSALLEVKVREGDHERTIVFSGDLGQRHRILMHDPTYVERADYVVLESTYGDRNHTGGSDLPAQFARIINDTVARGGNVVIPTFAIDRAQEILYYLSVLAGEDRIPRLTVFLDSPMAINVTEIYKEYKYLLDEQTQAMLEQGRHPFQFEGLHFVRSANESRAINAIRGSCIILAGSGMCTGGRIKHHLRHNISRPESTLLFVGYQAEDTLGRHIVDGEDPVRIHGKWYPVKAKIEQISGLSAHADHDDLMDWVDHFSAPPKRIFLTHGEVKAAEHLARSITDRHGYAVEVPAYEQVVELG